ncbi:MAG TPA: gephyrin-like molybdotransferase Glp [Verrucomicrobiae bacterium]|nr:gephyrin-like molybdotransferase Glp [Verrucomicrobiae bacterium]
MLELEDALTRILAGLPKLSTERISLNTAHRRFAAQTIIAPIDLPAFDNSSMDGYAVRAEDVALAGVENPVRLHVIGRVAAGESFSGEIASGECVRIFTGSPLPRGADAIVMQEDTRSDSNDTSEVEILDAVKPWENVRFHGEDVKRGTPLIQAGERMTVGRVALLAAMGLAEIEVTRRPRVALIATGSELKESGQRLEAGQIYESNRATLAPLIESAGGVLKIFPIVPDHPTTTRNALEHAFAECDCVITCGGVSVGEMDFVKSAFEALGGKLDFWKVAIKPGKPFVLGELGSKRLFGLPGNPISALVTFLLLARPAILHWQGATETGLEKHPGTLAEPLNNPGDRRHFIRVRSDANGRVFSAGIQASHALSSLANANGLVDLPPHSHLPAGATTTVLRWE